jgi:hypothetical protein
MNALRINLRGLCLFAPLFGALAIAGCAQKASQIAPVAEKPSEVITIPTAMQTLKQYEAMAAKVVDLETFKPLSAIPTDAEKRQRSSALQMLATARSFAGDTVGAITAFDANRGATPSPVSAATLALIAESSAEDALQAIVAAAKSRQIVILNEAHHVSMNRAFAMRLARELRKLGFEYLACEGFSLTEAIPGSTAPLRPPLDKGYPAINSGFYLREPYFGEFMRDAIRDGWKFVEYEHSGSDDGLPMIERMRIREEGQANNLVERIFRKHPQAKVFIYVGFGHAAKVAQPFGPNQKEEWMAARLKSKTGIDPLTIDQASTFARADRARAPAHYTAAIDRHKLNAPFVMRGQSGKPIVLGAHEGSYDFQIIYPDYAATGRADSWRESLAGRRVSPIPVELLPKTGRRMIYAFAESEPEDAVPIDAALVEAGKPTPSFMLPAGKFRYRIED